MKKYIVITSIFNPTEAILSFGGRESYSLIVVGDKKTPIDWQTARAKFLSIEHQENMGTNLAKLLPYNHYGRKMMGYLHAIRQGADVIIDTDDDNIPKDDWSFPAFYNEELSECIQDKTLFVNIYRYYTSHDIWPRGLPLNFVTQKDSLPCTKNGRYNVGIWQGLADEDPDVDAIYRMTKNQECIFSKRERPLVVPSGIFSPFNSQNTAIIKELFPLLFLPSHVTFRFTDILRSIVAQPIMWAEGYVLGFTNATVIQKRNPHDYMKDFISEIPMYTYVEKVAEIAEKNTTSRCTIVDNLFNVYTALEKENIVNAEEINLLEAWLCDIDNQA